MKNLFSSVLTLSLLLLGLSSAQLQAYRGSDNVLREHKNGFKVYLAWSNRGGSTADIREITPSSNPIAQVQYCQNQLGQLVPCQQQPQVIQQQPQVIQQQPQVIQQQPQVIQQQPQVIQQQPQVIQQGTSTTPHVHIYYKNNLGQMVEIPHGQHIQGVQRYYKNAQGQFVAIPNGYTINNHGQLVPIQQQQICRNSLGQYVACPTTTTTVPSTTVPSTTTTVPSTTTTTTVVPVQ